MASGDGRPSPYHRAMSRRLVSPTLVGRATELEAVARALDSAAAGTPIHQLIAGEAGVGKSRLVLAATEMASARGMRVLEGGCADIGDGGVPYGPIVEALRTLTRSLDAAELDDDPRFVPTRAGATRAVAQPGGRSRRAHPDRIPPGPPARRRARGPPAAVRVGAGRLRRSRISTGPTRRRARRSPSSSGTCAPIVSFCS